MSAELLKGKALHRISKVVDQAFEESEIFREEVNKAEFMGYFSDRIDNGLSPEKLVSISEERLTRIVKQTMAVDVLSGLLSDLTPEEMEIFDAAVEGR